MNSTKPLSIAILLLMALAVILPAQTMISGEDALPAQTLVHDMDALLDSEAVSWAEAARFVLPAAGVEAADAAEAFAAAAERGWLPRNAEAQGAVNFAGVSFLLMKAFDLSGGLLYSIFPGPRYSYRELVYKGILQGQYDRSWKVPGVRLITLIGRTIEVSGAEE
jgi:hypothetical protein